MKSENIKTLNLFPIDYPFETLVSRIKAGKLKLDPDFQRKYKWDKDGNVRGSKFVESCLMRIPLPACYFAEELDSSCVVIDGVQRLTTIVRFFNDEFALEGLTVYKELNGLKFSQIERYRSVLESTTIRCIVLRNDNSKQLVAEIFARLNQGAVTLSPQEIRHAIYPGPFDELISRLSKDPIVRDFKKGPHSKPDFYNSRESEELVLRFFALRSDLSDYEENMASYLDAFMRTHQNLANDKAQQWEKLFRETLGTCVEIFGGDAFKNLAKETGRRSASLWDVQMIVMSDYSIEQIRDKKDAIVQAFHELCDDSDFARTLSGRLVYRASILKRRHMWRERLENVLNH